MLYFLKTKAFRSIVPIALTLFIFVSCNKDDGDGSNDLPFRAEVLSFGVDCQDVLIQFTEDQEAVTQITSNLSAIYYAGALPRNLQVPGTQIRLSFRPPLESDPAFCTTVSPDFPLIVVLNAAAEE